MSGHRGSPMGRPIRTLGAWLAGMLVESLLPLALAVIAAAVVGVFLLP